MKGMREGHANVFKQAFAKGWEKMISGKNSGVWLLLFILVAAAAGVFAFLWFQQVRKIKKTKAARLVSIPDHWPITTRRVATTPERHVWQWLQQEAFPNHHVLPKLPVTRFTLPEGEEDGKKWFQFLSNMHCTFTICSGDAQVIGCVDVLTPHGPSREIQQIKHSLLTQCGIGYRVIRPDLLPPADALSKDILQHHAAVHPYATSTGGDYEHSADLETMRQQLHQQLDRNRTHRQPLQATDSQIMDHHAWPADSALGDLQGNAR